MDTRLLAQYVVNELDAAYGGVKSWSEADAFEGIYATCYHILKEPQEL